VVWRVIFLVGLSRLVDISTRDQPNHYERGSDPISINESSWHRYVSGPEAAAKAKADQVSYLWDALSNGSRSTFANGRLNTFWTAEKARQRQTRHAMTSAARIGVAKRPQYLFSGLTKCGVWGAGYTMSSKDRLGCFGARDQGRCDNHLTIRRVEVEARVLRALQEKLLRQDLFEEFCDEFTREMNRLRMEHRASRSSAARQIERIEVRRKLIEMVMDGVALSEVKDELNAARREELKAKLAAADAPPSLLHPEMAELYRQKVTALAQALERPENEHRGL
jgi:hypothetical protein